MFPGTSSLSFVTVHTAGSPDLRPKDEGFFRKHGLTFMPIKTMNEWVSTVQHSSIWSHYSIWWAKIIIISFTKALKLSFPFLELSFPCHYWGIIEIISLSFDMLAVCKEHCGPLRGDSDFHTVAVSHNWPPTSHQNVSMYSMCGCAHTWRQLCHRLSSSRTAHS